MKIKVKRIRHIGVLAFFLVIVIVDIYLYLGHKVQVENNEFIKWVDFNVTAEAMQQASRIDIQSYGKEIHCDWISLLAYAGVKTGGEFDKKVSSYIEEAADKLLTGEATVEQWQNELKSYAYFYEAYEAVLGEYLGEYTIEEADEEGKIQPVKKYGVKVFLPIAKGFPYNDYDDFGTSRSYGYRRPHLGHDMMGQIGTPIIAIESGYVEALGWNQYGGWRIGIRSFDHKRYYYYAHLRQNRPYAENLEEGDIVTAGDVIGYMGHTGYSKEENVNNIETTHLHVGIELIFDESQKESDSEIWIDCYQIVRFLQCNRSEVIRDNATKEWKRKYFMENAEKPEKKHIENKKFMKNKIAFFLTT